MESVAAAAVVVGDDGQECTDKWFRAWSRDFVALGEEYFPRLRSLWSAARHRRDAAVIGANYTTTCVWRTP